MNKKLLVIAVMAASLSTQAQKVATFDDVTIPEGQNYFNGTPTDENPNSTFKSGDFEFSNYNYKSWSFWCEFAVSKSTSTEYKALSDQYNNIVGSGFDGSANYAILYDAGTMMGPSVNNKIYTSDQKKGTAFKGLYVTNTAWVDTAIIRGDGYTPAFTKGDWLKVTATAILSDSTTKTADFYLADYRSENEADHYYLSTWKYFDLSAFGSNVLSVSFTISVNDVHKNKYGYTTPTYVAFDNIGAEMTTNDINSQPFSQALKEVQATYYFSIDGRRTSELQKGMNVIVTRYVDGTVNTRKVIIK
jgi:hypothetical protein